LKNLLHYSEIADAMRRPPATVHRWLKGVRGISPSVALEFERVTGIQAEAWIFPEKYGNPYLIDTEEKAA
jgi:plasmid maintenance system antidote protein VapI